MRPLTTIHGGSKLNVPNTCYRLRPKSRPSFPSRGFHATSRRLLLDECLLPAHSLVTSIHNYSGLPWAFSIPLTASLVKGAVVGPISSFLRMDYIRHKYFLSVILPTMLPKN